MNPSAQPVKIFRRTKLADFEEVDSDIATFELGVANQLDVSAVSLGSPEQ